MNDRAGSRKTSVRRTSNKLEVVLRRRREIDGIRGSDTNAFPFTAAIAGCGSLNKGLALNELSSVGSNKILAGKEIGKGVSHSVANGNSSRRSGDTVKEGGATKVENVVLLGTSDELNGYFGEKGWHQSFLISMEELGHGVTEQASIAAPQQPEAVPQVRLNRVDGGTFDSANTIKDAFKEAGTPSKNGAQKHLLGVDEKSRMKPFYSDLAQDVETIGKTTLSYKEPPGRLSVDRLPKESDQIAGAESFKKLGTPLEQNAIAGARNEGLRKTMDDRQSSQGIPPATAVRKVLGISSASRRTATQGESSRSSKQYSDVEKHSGREFRNGTLFDKNKKSMESDDLMNIRKKKVGESPRITLKSPYDPWKAKELLDYKPKYNLKITQDKRSDQIVPPIHVYRDRGAMDTVGSKNSGPAPETVTPFKALGIKRASGLNGSVATLDLTSRMKCDTTPRENMARTTVVDRLRDITHIPNARATEVGKYKLRAASPYVGRRSDRLLEPSSKLRALTPSRSSQSSESSQLHTLNGTSLATYNGADRLNLNALPTQFSRKDFATLPVPPVGTSITKKVRSPAKEEVRGLSSTSKKSTDKTAAVYLNRNQKDENRKFVNGGDVYTNNDSVATAETSSDHSERSEGSSKSGEAVASRQTKHTTSAASKRKLKVADAKTQKTNPFSAWAESLVQNGIQKELNGIQKELFSLHKIASGKPARMETASKEHWVPLTEELLFESSQFNPFRQVFEVPEELYAFETLGSKNRILGQGAYGVVIKVRHRDMKKRESPDHFLAIKVMANEHFICRGLGAQLKSEVRCHLSCNHPNVVKCYSAYETSSHTFLVLEGMAQSAQFLAGMVNEQRVKAFAKQLLNAAMYLHSNNIVHRDLKLDNILWNGDDVVKLSDFGWCADLTKGAPRDVCGSFQYMAPEILRGGKQSGKVDIWSIGCCIFEFLFGMPLFDLQEIPPHLNHVPVNDWNRTEMMYQHNNHFAGTIERVCRRRNASVGVLNFLKFLLVADSTNRPSAAKALRHPWLNSSDHLNSPCSTSASDTREMQEDAFYQHVAEIA